MYGKKRAILRSNGVVVVAGKSSPDSQGGSWHPMGYWQFADGWYSAQLRSRDQFYTAVVGRNLGKSLMAATRQELRRLIMAHYEGCHT